LTGLRSQVPPQRDALELCTKLRSQTSDPWRGVHVGAGPQGRWECVEDIQSCVPILHCVGISSCAGRSLEGAYSHTEKEMRGQRMHHKIASREGRAFVWLRFAQVNMLGKLRNRNREDWMKGSGLGWCSSGLVEGKAGLWLGNRTTCQQGLDSTKVPRW